ncbi:chorismate-binding protein [Candidatus Vidania fulgoroideorum]
MKIILLKNGSIIKTRGIKMYNIYYKLKKKINNNKYMSFLFKIKSKVPVSINLEVISFSDKKKSKDKGILKLYDYIYYEKLRNIKRKGKYEEIGNIIQIFKNKKKVYVTTKGNNSKKLVIEILKLLYEIEIENKEIRKNFFYIIKKNSKAEDYIYKFNKIKKYIKQGKVIQCQIGKDSIIKKNIGLVRLFKICDKRDICVKAYISLLRESIICFTPEILVLIKNKDIYLYPIAGTIKRGVDLIIDKLYEKKLINDKKELSEHVMLIDIARNDLNSISKQNTVIVKRKFTVGKFYYVQHIISEVKAKVIKKHSKKVLRYISPSGTLTGSPKIKSMEIIKKMEKDRGYYGGCVGFKELKKNIGIYFVIIRTAFQKGNYIIIKSASGIVNKSEIRKEYRELNNKMKVFLKK